VFLRHFSLIAMFASLDAFFDTMERTGIPEFAQLRAIWKSSSLPVSVVPCAIHFPLLDGRKQRIALEWVFVSEEDTSEQGHSDFRTLKVTCSIERGNPDIYWSVKRDSRLHPWWWVRSPSDDKVRCMWARIHEIGSAPDFAQLTALLDMLWDDS
jgi:hypothetical protein